MNILILGANSDVAQALAKKFAQHQRANIILASRDLAVLESQAADLQTRYQVATWVRQFDADSLDSHPDFFQQLPVTVDVAVVAFGYLGEQEKAQSDASERLRIIQRNFLGATTLLELLAQEMERRGHGVIIGISSVAGNRGRQSNYIYGAAKAALTTYLDGLRNRLTLHGGHVITVLPGYIRTKMTAHLKLPGLLTASPDRVADDIYRAFLKRKDKIYTPGWWRWIMWIIGAIPETVFKRMKL